MANQTDSYNAESKFSGVRVLPENLVIVGIDCEDEKRPELADPDRIHLKLDPDMVNSIALHGVRVPIVIRKFRGDDNVYVVAGRRRVLHAREANRKHAGDAPILVPCVPDDNPDPVVSFTVENEYRVDNTPLAKARHAGRLKARGHADSYVCSLYGITKQTLSNWRLLLETPPSVQKAIEEGKVTSTNAVEIAKLEPARQNEALQAAIDAGRGSAAREAVQRRRRPRANGEERPQRIGVAALKRFQSLIVGDNGDPSDATVIAFAFVTAILGEGPRALAEYPTVQKALRDAIGGTE